MRQLSLFDPIEIALTQGQVALVDLSDAHLATVKWRASTNPTSQTFYAVRTSPRPNRTMICMHRVILEQMLGRPLKRTEQVDHINGAGLDNRRGNLRLASHAENMRNRGAKRNNTSGYKGVSFHRQRQKWRAQIMIDGRETHLGYFLTPEEAHAAYCEAAERYHGKFARVE
jgi:hypothetical protein